MKRQNVETQKRTNAATPQRQKREPLKKKT